MVLVAGLRKPLRRNGQSIPADAVRIEECINAFDYNGAKPADDKAFAVHSTLATCPWNEQHLLMKVGIKGREISAEQRPVSNLVFLIDVPGSMQDANKLPLVKESLKLLLHQLDERDSVSYVVYAGHEGVVLPPTKMTESGRTKALEALAKHFNWTQIRNLAAPGLKDDRNESRAEFIGLLEILGNREG